jgi:hypothetical protein
MNAREKRAMTYDGLLFKYSEMVADVRRARMIAAPFLDSEAERVLSNLETSLRNARNHQGMHRQRIAIADIWPVRTRASTSYSRDRRESIVGTLAFAWDIQNADNSQRQQGYFALVGAASTSIMLHRPPEEGGALVARWQMECGDHESPGCHFHSAVNQYGQDGLFPEWLKVPRLPSVLLWPMDALDFLLGELFQDEWLKHISRKDDERRAWGKGQQDRIEGLLRWQLEVLEDWNTTPWMALKKAKPTRKILLGG